MKINLDIILLAAILFACNQPKDMDTYLAELHQDGELNGNVLVVRNDTVLYEKSFGFANGTKKHLLNSEHRFALGSIAKEFPGVAVMQLQEEGLLRLEDKLSLFMPQLPDWADKITIRHLFQYSSGLPKVDWEAQFRNGRTAKQEEIIQELYKLEELEFEPGTDYLYSNYNPFLLQKIVEGVSGMSFKEYVGHKMIIPFELEGIVVKEEYPFRDPNLMAMPFNEEFVVDDYKAEVTTICSSAKGMYQWFSQLDNFKILTKESMQLLSEIFREGDYIQSPIGYCKWEGGDIRSHFHHGNSNNYESLVRNYKQEGLMIILMTNRDNENLYEIADNIYEIIERRAAKR